MASIYIESINRKQMTSKKTGKPFIAVGIKANNQWINGFGGPWNEDWQQGMTIEADIVQNGQYWNFKQVDPLKAMQDKLHELEARVQALENVKVGKAPMPVANIQPPIRNTPPPSQSRPVPAAVMDFMRQAGPQEPPPFTDDDAPPPWDAA